MLFCGKYIRQIRKNLDEINEKLVNDEKYHQEVLYGIILDIVHCVNDGLMSKRLAKKLGNIVKEHEFYLYESGWDKYPDLFL